MPSAAQLAGLLWTAIYRPNDMKAIITYKVRTLLPSLSPSPPTVPLTRAPTPAQLWRDPLNRIENNPESGW